MKCEKCGTEVEWKTIMGHYYWVAANGIHTHEDCLAVVRASGTALAAERDTLVARVAALEAELDRCQRYSRARDNACSDMAKQLNAAETALAAEREANAHDPVRKKLAALESKLAECGRERDEVSALLKDKQRDVYEMGQTYLATAAKLAKAREALEWALNNLNTLEHEEDFAAYETELRATLASLDPPEAAEKTEKGK